MSSDGSQQQVNDDDGVKERQWIQSRAMKVIGQLVYMMDADRDPQLPMEAMLIAEALLVRVTEFIEAWKPPMASVVPIEH